MKFVCLLVPAIICFYVQSSSGQFWMKKFTNRQNQFSGRMYQSVIRQSQRGKNVIFSPISVAQTLGMVLAGAEGNTRFEIKRALRMNTIPDERLPNLMKKSFTNVALRHTGQTIRLANAIFVRDEYPVKQPYINTLRTYYKSAVKTFDVRNSTAASNLVNRWVASNTENRITDLVDPSAFTELTRLVLVNAIYFQASWKHKFSAAGEKQFQLTNGESVMVPFMHLRKMLYTYNFNRIVEFVKLPYKSGLNFTSYFVVGLPLPGRSLNQVKSNMHRILPRFNSGVWTKQLVEISMPVFRLSKKIDGKDVIRSMSVRDLFSSARANLSAISDEYLYVSDFTQDSFLQVNEEGTVGAAATAAILSGRSGGVARNFVVNRPFFFGVYNERSDSCVFLGKVENPLEG